MKFRMLRWSLLCLGVLFSGLMGCIPGALYTHQQLGGADPSRDLAATPQLKRLRSPEAATMLSLRGIKLFDPIERVLKLWGDPTRKTKSQLVWTDAQGTYLLRVLLGKQLHKLPKQEAAWRVIVRQIDIFSKYTSQLHPKNRALLDPKQISSASWRKEIFGDSGKTHETHLKMNIVYPQKGFSFLLLSELLPLQRETGAVFSFYLSEEILSQKQIVPLS